MVNSRVIVPFAFEGAIVAVAKLLTVVDSSGVVSETARVTPVTGIKNVFPQK